MAQRVIAGHQGVDALDAAEVQESYRPHGVRGCSGGPSKQATWGRVMAGYSATIPQSSPALRESSPKLRATGLPGGWTSEVKWSSKCWAALAPDLSYSICLKESRQIPNTLYFNKSSL